MGIAKFTFSVEPPLARLKLLQDEIPTEDMEPVDDSSEEDQSLEQDLDSLALGNFLIILVLNYTFNLL